MATKACHVPELLRMVHGNLSSTDKLCESTEIASSLRVALLAMTALRFESGLYLPLDNHYNSHYNSHKEVFYMIKDNMLSTNDDIDGFSPGSIIRSIANRARLRRLEMNLSQAALAKNSGVSLGTLKRFERTGEVSLKSLAMLAVALNAVEGFKHVLTARNYASFDEAVQLKKSRERKRGRISA